ncbi:uncharacterized protein LOC143925736 [Lithobates pipiens]
MTNDTRAEIYQHFLQPYLSANATTSTVVCEAGSFENWRELNFGAFFYFFSLEEIMTLNKNFTLNDLSPMDIASSVTTANVLLNATLLEKYLNAIAPQNVTVFLEALSFRAKQANLSEVQVTTIKTTLLATELRGLQANFSTFTTEQWRDLFQNYLLNLTVYFNQTLLEIIPLSITCDAYQAIVKAFSVQFTSMTNDTKEAIYQYFLQPYLSVKAATSTVVCDTGSFENWRELNFGAFFYFFSLEEIMTLNKNFTLNDLSPMDIASSVTTANVLLNATLLEKYLNAIAPQNVTVFLEALSFRAKQANLSEVQVTTIKTTLLATELRGLQANFSTFTTEQWRDLFQNYLLNLTVYFNQTLLEIIPLSITCDAYQAIVKAFSVQFTSMTNDTKEAIYQYFLQPYLSVKAATSTVVCDTGSFENWRELNFGAFFYFFSLEEIMTLNKNFTLNDLSPMGIAYSVTTANVLLNATLLEKYLSAIAPQNVTVFLEALSSAAIQANLSEVQVTTIKTTLLATEIRGLQANFSTFTTEQWRGLFQNYLLNLTVYFNQTLLEIIPLSISCKSYQAIVQAFSGQFTSMTNDTRASIYQHFLKPYLSANATTYTVVCDTGSFENWRELNFGAFFYFFSLEEIMTLNKNFTLNDLSPMDIASSVMTANVLLNATLLEKYLNAIAPQNVTVFLEALSFRAKQANLSEVQVTTIKTTLLATELRGLQANFSTFTTEQWRDLFQKYLLNLTVYFNQTLLEIIPLSITCDAYQAIVKAFSVQFTSMTNDTKEAIYQYFLQPYLSAKAATSTVVCDTGSFENWRELNFGAFFYFFSLEEIMTLNKNFTLNDLSPMGIAYSVTTANVLLNATLLEKYLSAIAPQNVTVFLEALSSAAIQANLSEVQVTTIKTTLLATELRGLQANFSTFTTEQWRGLFQNYLLNLTVYFNQTLLEIIPLSISCKSYQAIVQAFSGQFTSMTNDTRAAIYQHFLKPYLSANATTSTVVCDTGSFENWRELNFGAFFYFFSLEEIMTLNKNFTLNDLSPMDIASSVTTANVLLNATLLEKYLNAIAPQNVTVFLEALSFRAKQANLSEVQVTTIKTTLLATELRGLQANFSTFTTEQWRDLFQNYLLNLTVYFNQTLLEIIPLSITCDAYQAIVKAFSVQFTSMTNDTKEAIYQYFLQPYLSAKAATSTVVCDTGSFENWRELNFGAFFYFFSLEEIMTLNKNFTLNDLSPMGIAYSVTTANVLLNATLLEKYLSAIAPQNVTVFLEALSSAAIQANLSEVQVTTIKTTLLATELRGLQANFSTFTTEQWRGLFQNYLLNLTVYFNQTLLEIIPLSISCKSYQAIVQAFSGQFTSMTNDTRAAIYQHFLKPYLSANATTSTVVCDTGSFENWRELNFGAFFYFFSLEEIMTLNKNFTLNDLSPMDIASSVTTANVLLNATLLEKYLNAIAPQNVTVFLEALSFRAKQANLSEVQVTTIKTTLLATELRGLQANFSTFTTEQWRDLFQNYLLNLTVYFNQTLLEIIPLSITCDAYQAIVKAFSVQFTSMTNDTKEAIYQYFLQPYLSAKAATSTVVCDTGSFENWRELNFGAFFYFFSLEEIMTLNKNFTLNDLSPMGIAYSVTTANVLLNATLLEKYLSAIAPQNVTVFLEALSSAAIQANLSEVQVTTIKTTLLATELRGLQANFSTFTTEQWRGLFQNYLLNLTVYFNQTLLEIIPLSISCKSYQAIVQAFSGQFTSMTNDTRASIYQHFLKPYLSANATTSTVVCDTGSFENWRELNFGAFFYFFSLEEIMTLNKNFTLNDLSPMDIASSVTTANVLLNATLLEKYLNAIAPQNVTVFLEALSFRAKQANLSEVQVTTIKTTLLATELRGLQANFSTFTTEQWRDLFQNYLLNLTVYFNQTLLEIIPLSITCDAYQAIVKAFSDQFTSMTNDTKEAIYQYFLQPYLSAKAATSTVVCDTGSFENWRELNFGAFFYFFSLEEIMTLNKNFTLNDLSPMGIAYSVTTANVLLNATLLEKYLSAIAPQNVTVFLEALSSAAIQANLSEVQVTTIKTTLLATELRGLQANFSTFTTEQWRGLFQNYLLNLTVYFNQTLLEIIPLSISCKSYQAIVQAFSGQFTSMTNDTRAAIYQHFLKPYLSANATTSTVVCDTGSFENWRELNFGAFFYFFSLEEIMTLNKNFTLNDLSPMDIASSVMTANVLLNATLLEKYLNAIAPQNVTVFLEALSFRAKQANLSEVQVTTIKTTLLATELRGLQANFSTFTTEQWRDLFQNYLLNLTVYFNQTLLEIIPLSITCDAYQAIVKAFSVQFTSMTNDTKEAIYQYFLQPYLSAKAATSTVVCDTGSFENWRELNFGAFFYFFSLEEIMTLNKNFTLNDLSPMGIAYSVTTANVLLNATLLEKYLSAIAPQNVTVFLEALSSAAIQANLSEVQVTTIKTTLLATELRGLQANFSTFTTEQWRGLFQNYLLNLTVYFNQTLLEIIPLSISCKSYQAIVQAFSGQFTSMTNDTRASIYQHFLKPYLSANATTSTVVCDTGSFENWRELNFGAFFYFFSLEEIMTLNKNFTLNDLSPMDIASSVTTANVLLNATLLEKYLNAIAPQNVTVFLEALSFRAKQANLSEVQVTTIKTTLLATELRGLQANFSTFTTEQWRDLFQNYLLNLTVYFNQTLLEIIPLSITCDAYQAIVKAFSDQFTSMTNDTKEAIYQYFLQPYLSAKAATSTVVCDTGSFENWRELNFGAFFYFFSLEEIMTLNKNFTLNDLSPMGIAYSVTTANVLLNATLLEKYLSAIAPQNVTVFLEALSSAAIQANLSEVQVTTIKTTLLATELRGLQANFSTFTTEQWRGLFQNYLLNLTVYFNQTLLEIIPLSISCKSYQAIVQAFSGQFTSMTNDTRASIYQHFLKPYLSANATTSTVVCDTGSFENWRELNFGAFFYFFSLEEIMTLNKNFTLNDLSPMDIASSVTTANVLLNATLLEKYLNAIAPQNVTVFLEALSFRAKQANLSEVQVTTIKTTLLATELRGLQANFSTFTTEQWRDLFQNYLLNLTVYFNQTLLEIIPLSITCDAYQAIVKAFSDQFTSMTNDTKEAIYQYFLQPYLSAKAATSTVVCDTGSFENWRELNFGAFFYFFSLEEIMTLNKNFTLNDLSPMGIAYSVTTANVLLNATLLEKYLSAIAPQNVTVFLEALSSAAIQANLSEVQVTTIKTTLLATELRGLQANFSTFTTEQWRGLFQNYLLNLTVYFNQTLLEIIPLSISCKSYQAIVQAFSGQFTSMTNDTRAAIYQHFLKPYLSANATTSTVVCDTGSFENWRELNFGAFFYFFSLEEIMTLNKNFTLNDLSPMDIASSVMTANVLLNATLLEKYLNAIAPQNVTVFLEALSFRAKQANLSEVQVTTIKTTLLATELRGLQANFSTFTTEQWRDLFQKYLLNLTVYFNQTLLEIIPLSITCDAYQAIVKAFSVQFTSMTNDTKEAIYQYFLQPYLSAKAATSTVVCDTGSFENWRELNFGAFFYFFSLEEIMTLNKNFTLNDLSPMGIAYSVTTANVLLNATLLEKYLSAIAPQNVTVFLEALSSAAIQANLSEVQVTTIKTTLLATELRGLQANFSTFTTEQWRGLFQNYLLNLTVYFNQTLLEIIPLSISCKSYQAIVQAFSGQFTSMTNDTRAAIYQHFLKPYLSANATTSTVVCDTGSFENWRELNFGAFFYFFSLEEIMTLNKNFTLNDLSPMDIASSVTTANVLLNATLLEKYLNAIAPQNVTVFLEALSFRAKQANLSEVQVTTIKTTLLATELRGLQANFSTFTTEQWRDLFQKYLLNLTVYFNQTLLEIIPLSITCDAYQAIVKAFSVQFTSMTNDTKEAIYQYFLQPYLSAKAATSTVVCDTGSFENWRELNFGAFFYFFSLEEIMTLNKNFTLNDLSPMGIAYSVTTANVLLNATLLEKYLSAIAPQNVTVFLEALSSAAIQANLSEVQVTTIKTTLLATELRGLQANFSTFTTEQWRGLFQNYLLNLTVYFNQTLLEIIPLSISCKSYQAIVQAFSGQFTSMTNDTRAAIYQHFLKPYLSANATTSTVVCDTGSFENWRELNFGAFFYFFSLEEIMTLNKNFTLNDLSPMDIASSVTTANVLLNATLLEKYLNAIAPQNVTVFLEALSFRAKQANLSEVQVTTIKTTLLATELRGLQANFSTFTTEQWRDLFQKYLLNLTVYFNQTLLEIIPLSITCDAYQAIVKAFSVQFTSMTNDTKEAIYQYFLQPYLSAKAATSTVVCDTGSFENWRELNFGAFFYFFSLEEIMTLNKNFTLNDLSPMDIASSVTTANVLLNATLLEKYLNAIAPQNVTVFLEALSFRAKQANLSEVQVTTIKTTLLATELRGLQANFSTFTTEQWRDLFQNYLLNLTVYFNQTLLEIIPLSITCDAYQAIVKAFSDQFTSMTNDTKEAIYQYFLQPYLSAKAATSTVVCDTGSFENWRELNFGAFFYFFSLEEIMTLNKNFTLNDLSPMGIAYSVTTANVLLNATLLEKYLSAIAPQNVTVFLEALSSAAIQANLSEVQVTTIKTTLLATELRGLQANFSTFTTEQWRGLFQNYLLNLTVYFNQTLLEIIPLSISCKSYQAIVQAFSGQFTSMTNDTRAAIYQHFLKPYLSANATTSTVVCDTGSFENWRELNFGAFFYFFSLEEIMTLNKNFTLNDLSPMDIASSVTTANVLLNATLLEKYLNAIAPQNVTVFLEALSFRAKQANLSEVQVTTIKTTLLATELRGLQANFSTFTTEQWRDLFQKYLLNLTVYFNQTLLEIIPLSITCDAYQAIVKAFSVQFTSMTNDTKEAIYQYFLQPYLSAKAATSTVVCDTGSFENWRELNFGAFFYFFSLEEIMTLNKNFTLNDLSPMDIASSVTTANVLLNATLLEKYLNAIAPQNVTVFLEALSFRAKQANLSEVQVTTIKTTLLATELRGLQANFSTFTTEQWRDLFQNYLLNLTVYFNQTLLEIIPLSITCDAYQAIVKAFSDQFTSMTNDTKEAIYQYFLQPYLSAKAATSTVVCDTGSFENWRELNFGAFFYFFSLEEIMTLNKNFTLNDLSPMGIAYSVTTANVLLNATLLEKYLSAIAPQNVTVFLEALSSAAIQANLSEVQVTTIKTTLLATELRGLQANFSTFTTEQWRGLFQNYLLNLTVYFNQTLLEIIPLSISCKSYQAIVQAFSGQFTSMTNDTRASIYQHFLKPYLSANATTSTVVCDTGSFENWRELNFGAFFYFFSLEEIMTLNKNFTLNDLSPMDIASSVTTANVLLNATLLEKYLNAIAPQNVTVFLEALSFRAKQANLSEVQVTTIKTTLLATELRGLQANFSTFTTEQWRGLFQNYLLNLTVYFNQTLLEIIPLSISCKSYQAIVQAFSGQFTSMTNDTRAAIYQHFLKPYLSANATTSTVVCDTGSFENWRELNFGAFFYFFSLEEIMTLNKNFTLNDLSPMDIASSVTTANVLLNATLLEKYLNAIAPQNVTVFLEALSFRAKQANLSEVQVTTIKTTLLATELRGLQANFSTFTTEQWRDLFQNYLLNLTVYFNQTLLEIIPLSITCDAYQAIVKAFSVQFTSMTNDTKEAIYQYFLQPYLSAKAATSTVVCDTGSFENWRELNFGAFFYFFSLEEIMTLNKNFTLNDLSPMGIAYSVTTANILLNATLLEKYLSAIAPQNVTVFLEALSSAAIQANLSEVQVTTIKTTLLATELRGLQANFSTFTTEQWRDLFQNYLLNLTVYFNQTLLEIIPLSISCKSYQAIVQAFSGQFTSMTNDTRAAIYQHFLKPYLSANATTSTVVCDTGSFENWRELNFGAFFYFFSLEEIMTLNKNFTLNDLSPEDIAYYVTAANVLLNATLLEKYLSAIAPQNVTVFLEAFSSTAKQANLSEVQVTTIKTTLLATELRGLQANFFTFTTEQWRDLFQNDLLNLTVYFNQTLLEIIPLNISCKSYQAIVKAFSLQFSLMTEDTSTSIYKHFVRPYLNSSSTGPNPKCYKAGDDYSWIVQYLQEFVTYCTSGDLQSFSSNATLLQLFLEDSQTVGLIGNLTLQEDFMIYAAQLFFMENSTLPLQRIPVNIFCHAVDKVYFSNLSQEKASWILQSLKSCGANFSLGQAQLNSLLSFITNVTSETLAMLTLQDLVNLSPSFLAYTSGSALKDNLQNLSSITNWSVTQASLIVSNMVQSNFQINADTLKELGQLVIGVQSAEITNLSANEILTLAKNTNFTSFIAQAPLALKQQFVQEVIQTSRNLSKSIFETVPAALAGEIPSYYLLTSNLNVSTINQMQWTSSQAQVFFYTILTKVKIFTDLSVNILQGFTCGAANNLTDDQFVSLIKTMNEKAVTIESGQLSCIARRLTNGGAPTDFSSIPSNVLLFMGPYTSQTQCTNYTTRVGQANIDLLPQGSTKRTSLLSSAISCLNINTKNITKDNLVTLGSLACDLTGQEITSSDSYVLEALKTCSSFTANQRAAILTVLKAQYGDPSTWTLQTMNHIGKLSSALDSETLMLIRKDVKIKFFPGLLSSLKVQHKTTFTFVIGQLRASAKLASRYDPMKCDEEITTNLTNSQMDFIAASYSAAQLQVCIKDKTLMDNLSVLGGLAFDDGQLQVLKNQLNTIFPTGVPEPYLIQLGNIATMYSETEMRLWNITSVDTLATLIQSASWNSSDSRINVLVQRYLQLNPNDTVDATLLTVLAPYICSLNETLIKNFTIADLRNSAQPLQISTCSQSTKDLLFNMMASVLSSNNTTENGYYQIMKPVIGGAKASNLIAFSMASVDMDLTTFTTLNPNELKLLSAQNIKNLVGINVFDINTIANSTVLQAWAASHTQMEVNDLGLNVNAGVQDLVPDGVISIPPVTQTSGAGAPPCAFYLLLVCTLVALLHMDNIFL